MSIQCIYTCASPHASFDRNELVRVWGLRNREQPALPDVYHVSELEQRGWVPKSAMTAGSWRAGYCCSKEIAVLQCPTTQRLCIGTAFAQLASLMHPRHATAPNHSLQRSMPRLSACSGACRGCQPAAEHVPPALNCERYFACAVWCWWCRCFHPSVYEGQAAIATAQLPCTNANSSSCALMRMAKTVSTT